MPAVKFTGFARRPPLPPTPGTHPFPATARRAGPGTANTALAPPPSRRRPNVTTSRGARVRPVQKLRNDARQKAVNALAQANHILATLRSTPRRNVRTQTSLTERFGRRIGYARALGARHGLGDVSKRADRLLQKLYAQNTDIRWGLQRHLNSARRLIPMLKSAHAWQNTKRVYDAIEAHLDEARRIAQDFKLGDALREVAAIGRQMRMTTSWNFGRR